MLGQLFLPQSFQSVLLPAISTSPWSPGSALRPRSVVSVGYNICSRDIVKRRKGDRPRWFRELAVEVARFGNKNDSATRQKRGGAEGRGRRKSWCRFRRRQICFTRTSSLASPSNGYNSSDVSLYSVQRGPTRFACSTGTEETPRGNPYLWNHSCNVVLAHSGVISRACDAPLRNQSHFKQWITWFETFGTFKLFLNIALTRVILMHLISWMFPCLTLILGDNWHWSV